MFNKELLDEIYNILSAPEYGFELKMYDKDSKATITPKNALWVYIQPQDLMLRLPSNRSSEDDQLEFWKNEQVEGDEQILELIQRLRRICILYGVIMQVKSFMRENMPKKFSSLASKYSAEQGLDESIKRLATLAGLNESEEDTADFNKDFEDEVEDTQAFKDGKKDEEEIFVLPLEVDAYNQALNEDEDSDYDAYFKSMMKNSGITDIKDLSKEEKDKFFNKVDAGWNADDEVKEGYPDNYRDPYANEPSEAETDKQFSSAKDYVDKLVDELIKKEGGLDKFRDYVKSYTWTEEDPEFKTGKITKEMLSDEISDIAYQAVKDIEAHFDEVTIEPKELYDYVAKKLKDIKALDEAIDDNMPANYERPTILRNKEDKANKRRLSRQGMSMGRELNQKEFNDLETPALWRDNRHVVYPKAVTAAVNEGPVSSVSPDKDVTAFWKSEYKSNPDSFWLNIEDLMKQHHDWNAKKVTLDKDEMARIKGVLKAVQDLGIEKEYKQKFKALGESKIMEDTSDQYYYMSGDQGMKSNGSFTRDKTSWTKFEQNDKDRFEQKDIKPYGATKVGTFVKVNESKVMESYTGTLTKSYYTLPKATMIIDHNDKVDEDKRGARSRNIEAIFVETLDGERFKMPVNWVSSGKAMARHINEGGSFHDYSGKKIRKMSQEVFEMSKFCKDYETVKEAKALLKMANKRINYIKETMKDLEGSRNYKKVINEFSKYEPIGQARIREASKYLMDDVLMSESTKEMHPAVPYLAEVHLREASDDTDKIMQILARYDTRSNPEDLKKAALQIARGNVKLYKKIKKHPAHVTSAFDVTAYYASELANAVKDDALSSVLSTMSDAYLNGRQPKPDEMNLIQSLLKGKLVESAGILPELQELEEWINSKA